jgi:hypothetical protein
MKSSNVQRYILSVHFIWAFSTMFGIYMYVWATQWTLNPVLPIPYRGRFFVEQANSMLNGHFWVPKSALPIECFYIDGKCTGYYGVFPSLLRMPFVLIFGGEIPELNAVFISIAAGVSLWAALNLCLRILQKGPASGNRRTNAIAMVLVALTLGPGSVLVLIFDPYVYQEAIMWSVAGVLVATNLYWRWVNERRTWQIIGVAVACACSAGSRPTTAFVALLLLSGIALTLFKEKSLRKRSILGLATLALLPLLMSFGVLMLKMGTPQQDFNKYESKAALQNVADNNNGSLSYSARYIPTTVFTYLRPDALRFTTEWPWIQFRFGPNTETTLANEKSTELDSITYLPPLPKNSMLLERITSLTNIMPLALFATLFAAVAFLRKRQWHYLLLLAAVSTAPIILFVQFSIAARYLADFYPLLALGTVFSVTLIPEFEKLKVTTRRLLFTAMSLSIIFSVLAVTMLSVEYTWIYEVDRLTNS